MAMLLTIEDSANLFACVSAQSELPHVSSQRRDFRIRKAPHQLGYSRGMMRSLHLSSQQRSNDATARKRYIHMMRHVGRIQSSPSIRSEHIQDRFQHQHIPNCGNIRDQEQPRTLDSSDSSSVFRTTLPSKKKAQRKASRGRRSFPSEPAVRELSGFPPKPIHPPNNPRKPGHLPT